MSKAGELGTANLPPRAEAGKGGPPGSQFTVLENKGILGLAADK